MPARASATTSTCSASASATSAVVDERASPIPAGYRERLPAIPRIEAALAVHPLPTVPCHNDLLAENYLDDGERLWIVDYEYSGNNDPTFELGNTCQELGFDDAQVRELCAAYFGEATPALLARMRLQMIMSDVGWTLWAAIQARISTDRLRLLGLGRGALGASVVGARRPRLRGLAGGRPRPDAAGSAPHPGAGRVDQDVGGDLAGTRSSKTSTSSSVPSASVGRDGRRTRSSARRVGPKATLRSRPIDLAVEPDRLAAVDRQPVRRRR